MKTFLKSWRLIALGFALAGLTFVSSFEAKSNVPIDCNGSGNKDKYYETDDTCPAASDHCCGKS